MSTDKEKEKEKEKEKDKKKSKEKEKEKEKTFNDLDPDYQWNPSLDPDHIFEGEYELVRQVKKELPALEHETDKFVLVFLIARRHDLAEGIALLKKFLKLQTEYGFSSTYPPSFSHHPLIQPLRETPTEIPMLLALGCRDNHDRMLRYYFMGQDDPVKRDRTTTYTLMFWETYFLVNVEPLNAWRNGIAIVLDLKHFGWKNIDMSSKGRAINRDIQGTFPFRFRNFFTVNGGSIVGALIQAAKLVVPKKIMSRVQMLDAAQLKDHIPPKYLMKKYEGGESDLTHETWIVRVLELEASFFERGIWKLREGESSSPKTEKPEKSEKHEKSESSEKHPEKAEDHVDDVPVDGDDDEDDD